MIGVYLSSAALGAWPCLFLGGIREVLNVLFNYVRFMWKDRYAEFPIQQKESGLPPSPFHPADSSALAPDG